jgi:hypothetical protein
MTDETPSVEPTPTIETKSGWNSLTTNAKIAIGLVAFVVLLAVIGMSGGGGGNTPAPVTIDTTPTTISLAEQWSNWKSTALPIISKTQTDYTQTVADLTNGDYNASVQDFATLSQDANDMNGAANSPDTAVNAALQASAGDLQQIASTGLVALSSNDTTAFENAVNQWSIDTTTLATATGNANNTY